MAGVLGSLLAPLGETVLRIALDYRIEARDESKRRIQYILVSKWTGFPQ